MMCYYLLKWEEYLIYFILTQKWDVIQQVLQHNYPYFKYNTWKSAHHEGMKQDKTSLPCKEILSLFLARNISESNKLNFHTQKIANI